MTTAPGFSRLAVDERRRSLLECGRRLFTTRPYDELSMAAIAREAGISKALLYHYFPSKQAFFVATMQDAAAELAERVRPDPADPLRAQLDHALGAWLAWVDENRDAYGKLLQAANGVAEVREIVDGVRDATTRLILERLLGDAEAPPAVQVAICGWLWLMDGVCLQWVRRGEVDREQVHALLTGALPGILASAGAPRLAARVR
jgi:AcrR family transcriptional regulator